ncbi:disease resistance protein RPS6-like isoform X2 [Macadamia integrifolia]|uniref:disease resistance protein RPS6-like isoform X2 n=1 Tax=Macadamia integrifolia TaxID=60698 RepID=UPI001C4E4229|nr:disease resistance protein RPS6-like isoform X2 [Macadamia integrifolia]
MPWMLPEFILSWTTLNSALGGDRPRATLCDPAVENLYPHLLKELRFEQMVPQELVEIVECKKTMNQVVLPIFYDVDPADVRHHTGTYAEDLQVQNKRVDQRIIDEWKKALTEVGGLKGWDLKNIDGGDL